MKFKSTYLLAAFALAVFTFSCENNDSTVETTDSTESNQTEETSNQGNYSQEIGQNIANQTQATLGRTLMQAINNEGTEYAISFCSEKAIHLTDSVGISLNATVKRVSNKNRNPNNAGNADELKYIQNAKSILAKGETPTGLIRTIGNREVGYYPIVSNVMCMQCHGQPNSEISPETLSKINTLYPNDRATGYQPNELRGIWVVEMDKNTE